MRLLIAYDGSACSEAALDDLGRAGLPTDGEALIITVAETWLPPPRSPPEETHETAVYLEDVITKHRVKGQRLLNHAEILAKHAASRVRRLFPKWSVTPRATYGGPAWEILAAGDEFRPDLIVVGAQGHSIVGRLLLGSVSQKVVTEAACSVRIARGRVDPDPEPIRLLVGFDGSLGSAAAVDAVASRTWPPETEIRLLAATDSAEPSTIGRFIAPPVSNGNREAAGDYEWLTKRMDQAGKKLEDGGLGVTARIIEGNPKKVLITEAEAWHADGIFVGANAEASRLAKFLIGSTSAAIAARSHCSVEVIRKHSDPF